MATEIMKVEIEAETCCICGGGGDLMTPEEHDAGAPPMQAPLRTMLLHLNTSKVVPDGRLCASCIRRAIESYEFSTALSNSGTQPLSEKIRALRKSSRSRRVSGRQLITLWEYLNSHKEIATSFNRSLQAKEFSKRKWVEIAEVLNAQSDGAYKEWKEWSKYWVDYKAKLKKRMCGLRSAQSATGGLFMEQPLSDIDQKFLQLLGDDFGQGLSCVRVETLTEVPTNTAADDSSAIGKVFWDPMTEDPIQEGPSSIVTQGAHVESSQTPADHPSPEPITARSPPLPTKAEVRPPRRWCRRRAQFISQQAARRAVIKSAKIRAEAALRASEAAERSCRALEGIQATLRSIERLHELTQKIDVFIVVGGAGPDGSYSEEDIIMVERDTLAAAAAADDEELERGRNARGDRVYQCSVCPACFPKAAEFRAHLATHPPDALHSCWTCGSQFATRVALKAHLSSACGAVLSCQLCGQDASSAAELRRHSAGCAARCPACARVFPERGALAAHAHAAHGRGAAPPHVCPACFRTCDTPELLSAHVLRHRQAKHYVCGYDACILRFATRSNLIAHIRKCHAGELPEDEPPREQPARAAACDHCGRTFGSVAAMKRHARVHRSTQLNALNAAVAQEGQESQGEDAEGEIEYLEVEELEEMEYRNDSEEKPPPHLL